MITLIIVDPQYDFIEGGKLPVKGGTKALDNIVNLIKSGEVGEVIITQDAHNPDHCSFKDFGGQFPEHCIKDSHGYLVYQPIIDTIEEKNIKYSTVEKGVNKEEFSGFTGKYEEYYDTIEFDITEEDYTIDIRKSEVVVVCGLAGDICVLNTIKATLPAIPNLQVFVKGTASLDGGDTLTKYMEENNIKEYKFQ